MQRKRAPEAIETPSVVAVLARHRKQCRLDSRLKLERRAAGVDVFAVDVVERLRDANKSWHCAAIDASWHHHRTRERAADNDNATAAIVGRLQQNAFAHTDGAPNNIKKK